MQFPSLTFSIVFAMVSDAKGAVKVLYAYLSACELVIPCSYKNSSVTTSMCPRTRKKFFLWGKGDRESGFALLAWLVLNS